MLDRKDNKASSPTEVGAYEAKTKFSELIARAEKGERFVVTKHGRPVARIEPPEAFDRDRARQAAEAIRALARQQGPMLPQAEAQRQWEKLKADIEQDRDARVDGWLKS